MILAWYELKIKSHDLMITVCNVVLLLIRRRDVTRDFQTKAHSNSIVHI